MKILRPKLVGIVMKRPPIIRCRYCVHGLDTAPKFICSPCHDKFKVLLRSHRWVGHTRYFKSTVEHCRCEDCLRLGISTPTKVVDHIKPWSLYPTMFWDEENHQGLCIPCHNRKSQHDGSFDRR